jgi:hypothetical protein
MYESGLRRSWRELQPTEAFRAQAETFLMSYSAGGRRAATRRRMDLVFG